MASCQEKGEARAPPECGLMPMHLCVCVPSCGILMPVCLPSFLCVPSSVVCRGPRTGPAGLSVAVPLPEALGGEDLPTRMTPASRLLQGISLSVRAVVAGKRLSNVSNGSNGSKGSFSNGSRPLSLSRGNSIEEGLSGSFNSSGGLGSPLPRSPNGSALSRAGSHSPHGAFGEKHKRARR
jgi:hypothetical protein